MTAQKALDLANGILTVVGEPLLSPVPLEGTERQKIEVILKHYAARVRAKNPLLQAIRDDKMIPDIVIQKIVAALSELD